MSRWRTSEISEAELNLGPIVAALIRVSRLQQLFSVFERNGVLSHTVFRQQIGRHANSQLCSDIPECCGQNGIQKTSFATTNFVNIG